MAGDRRRSTAPCDRDRRLRPDACRDATAACNPFNPCLPDPQLATCPSYVSADTWRAVRRLAELVLAQLSPARQDLLRPGPAPCGPWSVKELARRRPMGAWPVPLRAPARGSLLALARRRAAGLAGPDRLRVDRLRASRPRPRSSPRPRLASRCFLAAVPRLRRLADHARAVRARRAGLRRRRRSRSSAPSPCPACWRRRARRRGSPRRCWRAAPAAARCAIVVSAAAPRNPITLRALEHRPSGGAARRRAVGRRGARRAARRARRWPACCSGSRSPTRRGRCSRSGRCCSRCRGGRWRALADRRGDRARVHGPDAARRAAGRPAGRRTRRRDRRRSSSPGRCGGSSARRRRIRGADGLIKAGYRSPPRLGDRRSRTR